MFSDLEKQLENYRITTAEIIYHLPDHPELLQSFIWQELDLAPEFPVLRKFLTFWAQHIEGPIHSVQVANTQLIKPGEFSVCDIELSLH